MELLTLPLIWVEHGRRFWRTPCGRFDLIETEGEGRGYFCAIDWVAGERLRAWSRETCVEWCAERKAAAE
jgi:hypothetical protein